MQRAVFQCYMYGFGTYQLETPLIMAQLYAPVLYLSTTVGLASAVEASTLLFVSSIADLIYMY